MPKLLSLRPLLLIDAATCAVMGLALDLGAAPLAALTGLPAPLLLYAGLGLLPIALFMALVAWRPHPAAVRLAVTGNAAWAAASLVLLVSGWVAPTTLGVAFVVAQALAVAGLAMLEHAALKTARPQAA
ncbi:hypothetical protein [Pelagibius marinus]|uniref:hypothetical protein n=1 Tax=Pelagibius marinus TaxID=2762760 RepID=UPI001D03B280|nr:hypothetical protein [Pelagibius marinus]